MTHASSEILVIGAGVIGLSAALRLRQAGLRVTVLERGSVGREASWAGGGILSPLHPWRYRPALLQLATAGMQQYPNFVAEIQAATGIDPEWLASGMWVLNSPEAPLPADAPAWGADWGWQWQQFSAAEMRARAPFLHADSALFCPEVAQVRNPRLLAGLRAYVEQLGVAIHEHQEVEALARQSHVWKVSTHSAVWESERVLLSAGPWSKTILERQGISTSITPVRGQMALLQGEPGALPQIVLEGSHYLVQRKDGQILVGSTSEDVGFCKGNTEEALAELRAFAERVFPAARAADLLQQWSGLRPGSPDNIPYIGAVPEHPGLYLAAGHFRYGLTTAPITAELLRALILEQEPPLDPTPYRLPLSPKA
ncbi:glycine oxidase ThiO [Candidatus Igneacidithiobacillus taiwanensis]|uniref:glycine oxidase ThiO n=1 Tax=Candidatus Igneacidithiobacillus taiwanensis TaxID=1945924 RepID=UPI00289642CE|nr:glycine oxidase ThiO [Candidatus Igneacidithiobacillus taiwanensis]MCE5360180.1 glycine oxidase ThiO [Acidithiobacillus sp.]